jgi:hypothetical protein
MTTIMAATPRMASSVWYSRLLREGADKDLCNANAPSPHILRDVAQEAECHRLFAPFHLAHWLA